MESSEVVRYYLRQLMEGKMSMETVERNIVDWYDREVEIATLNTKLKMLKEMLESKDYDY